MYYLPVLWNGLVFWGRDRPTERIAYWAEGEPVNQEATFPRPN